MILIVLPTVAHADPDFYWNTTTDFDAGTKSDSLSNWEIETLTDNLLKVWLESEILQKFRYSLEGYEKCYNCKLIERCAGGCKALSLGMNGNPFSPDPYCSIYGLNNVNI